MIVLHRYESSPVQSVNSADAENGLGLPPDSAAKWGPISNLQTRFDPQDSWLIIHEYGIWPSSEMPELFKRIRSSQGLDPDYTQYRVEEIVSPTGREWDYVFAAAAVPALNIWDFSLLFVDDKTHVYFSHDEWACFGCHSDSAQLWQDLTSLFDVLR